MVSIDRPGEIIRCNFGTHPKILEHEWGVLEVIEESSRGSNNQVDTLRQLVRLSTPVCATDDNSVRLAMI